MKFNEFAITEEKTRLDPKCWKGKKIGNPKTKMKGGVRVNNCVPAESVEEARAIIRPEDGIGALKKFSAYLKKNIVDLASMADFELEHSKQPYVDERFEGFLSKADGTPITPIFNVGGKLALVGPNKEYLNVPTEMYYRFRGFMYGGALESDLIKILGYTQKGVAEEWSQKYKDSINCSNPKGFSQRAHCAGKKKNEDINGEYNDEAGMAQGNLYTIAQAAQGLLDTIDDQDNLPEWVQEKIARVEGMLVNIWNYLQSQKAQGIDPKVHELAEEFDMIESAITALAEHNGVDAELIWEDLESLSDDELYVFAATMPIMEDWQKVNKKDKTDGMSSKAVKAYRREHPGSKLKTAVTTKPSKLKRGSKASKRRKSYCSRSRGQMKMHNISCAKTPDKAICKARRRWNC